MPTNGHSYFQTVNERDCVSLIRYQLSLGFFIAMLIFSAIRHQTGYPVCSLGGRIAIGFFSMFVMHLCFSTIPLYLGRGLSLQSLALLSVVACSSLLIVAWLIERDSVVLVKPLFQGSPGSLSLQVGFLNVLALPPHGSQTVLYLWCFFVCGSLSTFSTPPLEANI